MAYAKRGCRRNERVAVLPLNEVIGIRCRSGVLEGGCDISPAMTTEIAVDLTGA
jgi:hypothetical protein